jgi:hypothetical protein
VTLALTPEQSDALIREVDDAVREEEIFSFWTRYGKLVAVLIVLGLAGFGGWLLWQHYQTGRAEENSERFAQMLKSAQSEQLSQEVYAELVKSGGPGYRTQAELVKAALASGKGDTKGAIASFDGIIADASTPQPLKDLALVRRTALVFDQAKPDEVIAALKGLAVPGNPWFGSAGEMVGVAYLKSNKSKEAGEMFASISRDPVVTDSIRLRAGQMASTLGVAPEAIGSVADQAEASANAQ